MKKARQYLVLPRFFHEANRKLEIMHYIRTSI